MSKKSPKKISKNEKTATGIVIKSTGSWYDVRTDEGNVIPSKIRGKFRLKGSKKSTNPIAVGDEVEIRLIEEDGSGLIVKIFPRRNKLVRRAAGRRIDHEQILVSNVDIAWCVQAVDVPKFNPGFVDRFIVMAEMSEIQAGIVITKNDLEVSEDDQLMLDYWEDLYSELGYPVIKTSMILKNGLEEFTAALIDKVSVVAGPSGAGKSTLLNAIEPSLNLRTGEISERTRKGKHTTTNASLHPLSAGGYIVDTPGIREYGIIDLEYEDLGWYFKEMRPFLNECKFHNCTHEHEPGCAVQFAVEEEFVSELRYISYLNILDSLRAGKDDIGR